MKYARVLLENCPKNTTKVFVDYYTGKYQPQQDIPVTEAAPTPEGGYAASAANAVQNLTNLLPLPYMNKDAVASPASQGNIKPTVSDGQVVIDMAELSS